jgi:hypothetical protein
MGCDCRRNPAVVDPAGGQPEIATVPHGDRYLVALYLYHCLRQLPPAAHKTLQESGTMPLALSVAAKKSLRHAPPSSTCFFGLLVAYYIESQPGRCTALRGNLLGGSAWRQCRT